MPTTETFKLPACVYPQRGTDAHPYDEFGEEAPLKWHCACGAILVCEHYVVEYAEGVEPEPYNPIFWQDRGPEPIFEGYRNTSDERKREWLAKHQSCTATCFNCRKVPVEGADYWCDACSDAN